MSEPAQSPVTFAYRGETPDGQKISGTIDARDAEEAARRLQSLQLQRVQLQPESRPSRAKALRGEDFLAFNQQLAQLTGAGLPVEQGLRLMAAEVRRGSMRRTLDLVAGDLESGSSLPEAVAAHRNKFPPLYAQLIDAGIRAGNLSGILLNLGRHLTLMRRLQAALWQTLSYPVIVMLTFFGVMYFVLVGLVPKWEPMLNGISNTNYFVRGPRGFSMGTIEIPWITQLLLQMSHVVSSWPVWAIFAVVAALFILAWGLLRSTGQSEGMTERLLLPMPMVGSVLRRNLVSRWCHAVALAVEAGMDLPASIKLADDAIGSPRLNADGAALIAAVSSGLPISTVPAGKILPATVVAAMELSSERGNLPVTLRALSEMYQQQAELRLSAIQAVLTPILLILIGLCVGLLMLAMFAPMMSFLNIL